VTGVQTCALPIFTLPEFLELSENLELIPVTRIQQIRKENEILYQKLSFGNK